MRSTFDRIRHTIGFEAIGLLMMIPLLTWLFGVELAQAGGISIVLSLLATGWNFVFNYGFDRMMLKRWGHTNKSQKLRVLHACSFEGGLIVISIPLIAWYLGVGFWQALLMDMSFVVFYLFYTYFYNLAYDKIFPIPQPSPSAG
ncbi:PACE efflux transporter [Paraferrimonas sedimenticola]|uniref:Transporter n=1 Tax=Paraferrimonas sedimenticola TaxID=375674 RepID=A0AA37S001_9GAMM|nr:PACE efflux transporter [Paraferrimonas sedimenticola]GLP97792.1 transporter [Paraferrimonas sedimenticola]